MIDEVEPIVWTISLLLNHCDVFAEGLLCVLQLSFQALDILLMHHLLVRLLECDFSTQVLHFTVSLGFYARDLLLFSSPPDFIEITEQCVHKGF